MSYGGEMTVRAAHYKDNAYKGWKECKCGRHFVETWMNGSTYGHVMTKCAPCYFKEQNAKKTK